MIKLVNIHELKNTLLLIIIGSSTILAQQNKAFSSLNEVLEFSKSKNYVLQNAKFQTQLAILTKKTAIGTVFNPKINTSIQALNNFNQQVSFLPAEAFGGAPGSFKEVIIGQQYVSTFNIQPQFDILNLSTIAQIKSAKINEQLVENQNKINEQNLYDKINTIYFNILSFNGQKEILNENLSIAETILKIVNQKYSEGIARKQEVNEAEVNFIAIKDKLEQLEMNSKIQYQILDLFFENTIKSELKQTVWYYENKTNTLTTNSNLLTQNINLQRQLAQQEHKSLVFQNLPVLSFVSSFNWQNLSNTNFFASGSNWQNFNYVGLKLGWELPTVQRLSNTKSKQIQLETLKNNAEHSSKETNNSNEQMVLEYEKSLLQIINYKKIYELKKDTYEKNFNQFKENVLPLDKLLISQNDMLISKINVITVLANVGFNRNKIEINNKF